MGLARTGWPLLDTSAFGWEDLESFPKECLMPCTLTSLQISGLNCSPLLKNYRSLTAQLPLFSNNQELSIAEALVPILIKGRSASYSSYSTHRGGQPSSVMKSVPMLNLSRICLWSIDVYKAGAPSSSVYDFLTCIFFFLFYFLLSLPRVGTLSGNRYQRHFLGTWQLKESILMCGQLNPFYHLLHPKAHKILALCSRVRKSII